MPTFLPRVRLFFFCYKWLFLWVLLVLTVGGGAYAWYKGALPPPVSPYQTAEESDVYVRFDMEVYDSIQKNYWMKPDDLKLPELFRLSVAKVASSTASLPTNDRVGTAKLLAETFKSATSTDSKRQMALQIVTVALYNLPPAGRDGLLSKTEETALRQNVSNINPAKDLYQELDLPKGAPVAEVTAAYAKKTKTLREATTTEAKAELEKVAYANSVLTKPNAKTLYDQSGIEPTITSRTIGSTLYVHIGKISPTTLQEFALTVNAASTTASIDSMILDLRGNVGGALDFMPAFFGLFVGQNQFAFDLFHQGDYQAERTNQPKFDQLIRYKEIAIFTDNMTQSTAEIITAAFKRFHLGTIIGNTTRGWGTVENTYPLQTVIDPNTSYSLLLVNSITLRDDNQPIEGRGVEPDIDISKTGWENKLPSYFHSTGIMNAIRQTAAKPPLK